MHTLTKNRQFGTNKRFHHAHIHDKYKVNVTLLKIK